MKKATPVATKPSAILGDDNIDSSNPSKITDQYVTVHLRNPARPEPPSHFFAVVPGVDTEALLCHTAETLASLSVMASDLARELEGPRRHVILAIQQLSALGELLVNRALDNLAPPRGSNEAPSN